MPTSAKQIAANRRNARRSTGPRTPAGKAAVRHNALKHGILARETIITHGDHPENQADLEQLLADLHDDCRPEGPLEELLVQQIAVCYWRLRRILHADSHEFGHSLAATARSAEPFEYAGRLITTHTPALPPSDRVNLILRYEATIQRQLTRALNHLERLQRQRRGEPTPLPATTQLPRET